MFQNISKSFLLLFAGIILGAGVLMGSWAADALNAPGSNPPLGSGVISVDSSGRVGIATTTPSQQLTVAGRIQTTAAGANPGGVVFPDGTIQTTAAGTAAILADNVASGVFGSLQGGGAFSFPNFLGINTSTKTGLPQALSVYGSAYVSSSVSIGTLTSAAPAMLTIVTNENFSSGSNPAIRIVNSRNTADAGAEIQFQPGLASNWWTLGGEEDSSFRLYRLTGSTTRFMHLRMLNNGFLGIAANVASGNSVNPQSALHVMDSGTTNYLQVDTLSVAPLGSDCDNALESGRMKFDAINDIYYICSGASGWVGLGTYAP